jgi:N4-gp56 family major capsid protein
VVTTSNLSPAVLQTLALRLLSVPVPNMIHNIPAERYSMPRNGGTTLRMRRYNPLNTAMIPLGNSGQTPPGQNLTNVDIDAKISFYGTYISINEQVTLQNQESVLNEAAKRLGVSLRLANRRSVNTGYVGSNSVLY